MDITDPVTIRDIHDTLGEISAHAERIADALEAIQTTLEAVVGESDFGGRTTCGFVRVLNMGD